MYYIVYIGSFNNTERTISNSKRLTVFYIIFVDSWFTYY